LVKEHIVIIYWRLNQNRLLMMAKAIQKCRQLVIATLILKKQ